MLTQLFVDNYKALVNFSLDLPRQVLLMGVNGTGKTSVFEAFDILRQLVLGGSVLVPSTTLTRWQDSDTQTFRIDATIDEHAYRYEVKIRHRREAGDCRVHSERLDWDNAQSLFAAEQGKAQLYRDDGSKGPEVLADSRRSSLPIIAGRPDNKKLTRFVEWLGKEALICRINPAVMGPISEADSPYLDTDLSNFASWWRHLHDEDSEANVELRRYLEDAIPGFRGLEFRKVTEKAKRLTAKLGEKSYGFDELSEGQRVLIVLYSLLVFSRNRRLTLLLDEPDNFLSPREIQPFYNAVEAVDLLQIVMITHHPTLTNLMAGGGARVFRRGVNTPAQIEPFQAPPGGSLTASEYVARGFFDGIA